MNESSIFIKHIAYTKYDQHLKLIGNLPQLGSWDPQKGIIFTTNEQIYPEWQNQIAIVVPKYSYLEFKFAIFEGNHLIEWENIENRKYKCRYKQVQLKLEFNVFQGTQIVLKKFDFSFSSHSSFLEQNNIKKLKQNNILNPFDRAQSSDSNSDHNNDQLSSLFDISPHIRSRRENNLSPELHSETINVIEEEEHFKPLKVNTGRKENSKPLQELLKKLENNKKKQDQFSKHDILYEEIFDNVVSLSNFDELIIVFWSPIYVQLKQNRLIDWKFSNIDDFYIYEGLKSQNFQFKIIVFAIIIDEQYEIIYEFQSSEAISTLLLQYKIIPVILDKEYQTLLQQLELDFLNIIDNFNTELICQNIKFIKNFQSSLIQLNRIIFNYIDVKKIESDQAIYSPNRQEFGSKFIYLTNSKLYPLINFISQINPDIQIAFNFQSDGILLFQGSQFFKLIIESVVNASVIIFNNSEQAQETITYLQNKLDIQFQSIRGIFQFKYMGRRIITKICHFGISTNQFTDENTPHFQTSESPLSSQKIIQIKNIMSIYESKSYKFIIHQLNLLLQFEEENTQKIRLQIIIYNNKINRLTEDVIRQLDNYKQMFYKTNITLIIDIIDSDSENGINNIRYRQQLYEKNQIFWSHSIIKQNDLYLQEFIISGGSVTLVSNQRIINFFMKCIVYDPTDPSDFQDQLNTAINYQQQNYQFNSQNRSIIQKNNSKKQIESILVDLKLVHQIGKYAQNIWHNNNKISCDFSLNYLNINVIQKTYKNKVNRVFIFELEALIEDNEEYNNKFELSSDFITFDQKSFNIDQELICLINLLTQDESNQVHIISQHKKEKFACLENLDHVILSAENGFYCRDPYLKKWGCIPHEDQQWKQKVKVIFDGYAQRTEGSWVQVEDSSITINFDSGHKLFVKEQMDQIQQSIIYIIDQYGNLDIVTGPSFVTVRSSYVNQSVLAYAILQKESNSMKIDFLLAIGRTIQFESVYQTILSLLRQQIIINDRARVHLVNRECRPTRAFSYFDKRESLVELIKILI